MNDFSLEDLRSLRSCVLTRKRTIEVFLIYLQDNSVDDDTYSCCVSELVTINTLLAKINVAIKIKD